MLPRVGWRELGLLGWLGALVLVVLSTAAMGGGERRLQPERGVPVLVYHHLGEPEGRAVLAPWRFAEQMRWLAERGYVAVSLAELRDYVRRRASLPPRAVVITFDDGYESFYHLALPVLEEYGLRAAAFVVTRWLDEPAPRQPHFTGAQAAELVATGRVEIHSHTHDLHRYLEAAGRQRPALELVPPRQALADLRRSRQRIAAHVGQEPFAFAYPYGWHTAHSRRLVAQAGFELAFALGGRRAYPGVDPLAVPRIVVPGGIELEEFARLVEGTR